MNHFNEGDIVTRRGINVDGPHYEVTAVLDDMVEAENLNNGLFGLIEASALRLVD